MAHAICNMQPEGCEDRDAILDNGKKSLKAEIRSILKKLTPTNLDLIADKIKSLQVETYDDLQVLAETFFDKGCEDRDAILDNGKKSLKAEIRSILKKLTPTNLDLIADKIKSLQVETYDDLQVLAETFFDKVVLKTKFVEAYASLTKMLRKLHVPPPNKNITRNMATFLHLVVAKCWKMFRVDKSVIFKNAKTARQRLENEIPEDEKNREEKIQKQLYQLKLQQLRYVGNIRYIGELFKVGILTMRHMKHVIKKLLLASDENSLKCLCQLLTTVGSKLDKSEAKNKMDVCFKILKEISETCKPKMKLLLKDLMDLRDNSWLPRTQCASPHSLDEVSNVFEKEHETEEDWDKEIQEAELRQLEEEDWDREIREVELRKLEEEDWDREIQEAEMRKLEEDWDKEIHVAQLRKLNLGISKVM